MKDDMTRRDFAIATRAAAAVTAVGLSIASSLAKEKTLAKHKPVTKVNCFSETAN